MALDKDSSIFDDMSLSKILKDIYNNSTQKRIKIDNLLNDLKVLVKDVNDAVLVVPLIKEYLEVSVKNDEHLVKMATIAQRLLSDEGSGGIEGLLSNDEKQQLLDNIKKDTNELKVAEKENDIELEKMNNKLEYIKNEVEK